MWQLMINQFDQVTLYFYYHFAQAYRMDKKNQRTNQSMVYNHSVFSYWHCVIAVVKLVTSIRFYANQPVIIICYLVLLGHYKNMHNTKRHCRADVKIF